MDLSKLLDIQGEQNIDITDKELQAIYIYLSMQFENMSDTQKILWIETMQKLDPEFNDIEDD